MQVHMKHISLLSNPRTTPNSAQSGAHASDFDCLSCRVLYFGLICLYVFPMPTQVSQDQVCVNFEFRTRRRVLCLHLFLGISADKKIV